MISQGTLAPAQAHLLTLRNVHGPALGDREAQGDEQAKNHGAPFPAPVPQCTCAGSRRRLLAPPSHPSWAPLSPTPCQAPQGPLLAAPRSLRPGESARLTAVPGALATRRVLEAATVPWGPASSLGRGLRRGGGRAGELPQPVPALRPCCRAGGSAGSAAPPTAAAALRAPPSRCRAPAPSAPPGAPTGSWRAGTARSCRGARPRWRPPRVRSRRPGGRARGRLERCSSPRWR